MKLITAVFGLFMLSSCAQLTRLDTARTIGDGNTEIGAQLTAYGFDESASPDLGSGAVPFVVLNLNHGLTEKIDLMVSANTSANIFINPKFQIYGDRSSPMAIALLPGVDAQLGDIDSPNEPSVYFRPHFSGIISFHQNEWALFVEPKYVYQYWTETHFVGTTVGIDYTMDRWSFGLGYSYFPILGTDLAAGSNLFQIGISARRLLRMGQ